MKKQRILALVREGLIPPDSLEGLSEKEIARWKVEFDVITTLKELGHEVQPVAVYDDLAPIREAILQWKPHVAFMLLEEFHGVATYDHAIVSYLELMRQPYTGCSPIGLMLSKNKAISKRILSHHRIPTPSFASFRVAHSIKLTRRLKFPLLVKSVVEDASLGISQASIVRDEAGLRERIGFVHENLGTDAIAEEYIDGRELYVGVIGNRRLQTFPVWEMTFGTMPEDVAHIATAKVKWDADYQEKHNICTQAADLDASQRERIAHLCKRVYRALYMSGYARMDLRLRDDGQVYVIEANANPNLEYGEDFAESAEKGGLSYENLLQRIVNLGISYRAPWKG